MRVDEDLRDALADVLKDAVARVLVAERVIALVAVHGPDLKWESVRLIHDVLAGSLVFVSRSRAHNFSRAMSRSP